jgi:hypothetical protein
MSVVKEFTTKFEAVLGLLLELEHKRSDEGCNWHLVDGLFDLRERCISDLCALRDKIPLLVDALGNYWRNTFPDDVATMTLALDTMASRLRMAFANNWDHPVPRCSSNAPTLAKTEWDHHEKHLWYMVRRLKTIVLSTPQPSANSLLIEGESRLLAGGGQSAGKPRPRPKIEVIDPVILKTLTRNPNILIEDLAKELGVSTGFISEKSTWWKLNQKRLKISRKQSIEPTIISLNEKAINEYRARVGRQVLAQKEQEETLDDLIDECTNEKRNKVVDYKNRHRDASAEEIARECELDIKDVVAALRTHQFANYELKNPRS